MGKPKAPAPPDPRETSAAQTSTNFGTAIANNMMGMVNQNTPYGGLSYEQTDTYQYTDPYTGESYEIPRYTATTTLNPTQQETLNQSQAAEQNLASIANDQSAFLQDYLSEPAALDTSAVEGRLDELARARIDPRMERERAALEARLANQGLQPGSAAWEAEMGQFGEMSNDAYNQLALTGRQQAFGEELARRNQPINEIIGLLSGSQVTNPAVQMAQPQGAATTDVAGLINTNHNQLLNNWQTQVGNQNRLMGGLFGLGGRAITGGLI